jgi:hypothetical protein
MKELRFIAFSSAGTALFRFIHANYAAEEDTAQIASPVRLLSACSASQTA